MPSSNADPPPQSWQPTPAIEAELAALRKALQLNTLLLLAWSLDLTSIERRMYSLQQLCLGTAPDGSPSEKLSPLSRRERQVLELMARGLDNREIAKELDISPATVRNHVSRVLGKLATRDRDAAVQRAQTLGLV